MLGDEEIDYFQFGVYRFEFRVLETENSKLKTG
jgi:hypothetical protein